MKEKLLALINAIQAQYNTVPNVATNGMLMLWNPATAEISEEIFEALEDMDWQHSYRDRDRQFDACLRFAPKPTADSVAERALANLSK
jgi:hypothetical protein